MKIETIAKVKTIPYKQYLETKEIYTIKKEKYMPEKVYKKSQIEDKGYVYDKITIDDLKRISERSYSHLKQLIEDMITRQGKTVSLLNPISTVIIDEATRNEANKLIDIDGPLGIEAISDNIVNFAKALSGGDKAKLDTLRKAIDKGFREAEKMLGTLPAISQKTYDQIIEKLDNWENE